MAKFKDVYNTARWKKVRQFVIERDGGLCQHCLKQGKVTAGVDVDHIDELTEDNKHDWNIAYNPKNLRLLCKYCHHERHERAGTGLNKFIEPVEWCIGDGGIFKSEE